MNLKDLRDIIFFINAVLYSIIFFALLVVVLAVNRLASKYLDKTHTFMQDWVGPKMLLVQEKAEQVRQKTAGLPGQPRPEGAVVTAAPQRLTLPRFVVFRRKKKPLWRRVLPG